MRCHRKTSHSRYRLLEFETMVTPLRRQYLDVKRRYPDVIVFFRLGDFYETFDQDARLTAQELEIVLTSREMGKGQRVPMAGIPHHAVDNYLARLIRKGHKVAICEQLSEPGAGSGLVERNVVRVVTPGTVVEPGMLDGRTNNYLASMVMADGRAGLAFVDITTSEFSTTELDSREVAAELERLHPSELLVPQDLDVSILGHDQPLTRQEETVFSLEEARTALEEHFGATTLDAFGCGGMPLAVRAAGGIIRYLNHTQRAALSQVTRLSTYSTQRFMLLDPQTRRNLELFQSSLGGDKSASLLSVLDVCRTSMGSRLLRRWLGQPLLDVAEADQRLDAVEWWCGNVIAAQRCGTLLKSIADMERLVNRVRGGTALPRELVALRRSLGAIPDLKAAMSHAGPVLEWLTSGLRPCAETVDLIARAIADEPGPSPSDGGVIRSGFSEEVDRLRQAGRDAKGYLASLERQERERTGIKSLKVGYNRVFGYYIEVSKSQLDRAPSDYIRKQTLTDAERFYTPQLKEYESLVLNAQERIGELETGLFRQVCQQVSAAAEQILITAQAVARLDVLLAFAEVAQHYGYVRPDLDEGGAVLITGGRHPVVERALAGNSFVPNDTHLRNGDSQVVVLTGPNMSGKSTYLRQVALIVLMAQIGSFVPAEAASIGLVDRIFTRIGLLDDLATGRSTFMVEMIETANILHNATPRSLIILDEIGRGTSTYDGMSIARAVVEFIHNHPRLGCKTLFATHYHELVDLASALPRVHNFNVGATEKDGQVVFLRKVVPGGADRSYGIHVAQLAGLPRPVIQRASEVLSELEGNHNGSGAAPGRPVKRPEAGPAQLALLAGRPEVVEELLKLDVDSMTPLDAIRKLYELQKKARESV